MYVELKEAICFLRTSRTPWNDATFYIPVIKYYNMLIIDSVCSFKSFSNFGYFFNFEDFFEKCYFS